MQFTLHNPLQRCFTARANDPAEQEVDVASTTAEPIVSSPVSSDAQAAIAASEHAEQMQTMVEHLNRSELRITSLNAENGQLRQQVSALQGDVVSLNAQVESLKAQLADRATNTQSPPLTPESPSESIAPSVSESEVPRTREEIVANLDEWVNSQATGAKTDAKIIKNRILEAYDLKSEVLSLETPEFEHTSRRVHTLPNCIGSLTHLKVLDAYGHHIRSLPETIGNLSNLTTLNLARNNLSKLPSSISKLSNLEELYLQTNPTLTTLPQGISELKNLKHVRVANTNLSTQSAQLLKNLRQETGAEVIFTY